MASIAIVDGDDAMRELLRQILNKDWFDVFCAPEKKNYGNSAFLYLIHRRRRGLKILLLSGKHKEDDVVYGFKRISISIKLESGEGIDQAMQQAISLESEGDSAEVGCNPHEFESLISKVHHFSRPLHS